MDSYCCSSTQSGRWVPPELSILSSSINCVYCLSTLSIESPASGSVVVKKTPYWLSLPRKFWRLYCGFTTWFYYSWVMSMLRMIGVSYCKVFCYYWIQLTYWGDITIEFSFMPTFCFSRWVQFFKPGDVVGFFSLDKFNLRPLSTKRVFVLAEDSGLSSCF